ncbi:MAG TPA: AAA family ATPase, partial [Gemmata sp.]|nr:AAA family ATPase [Gemmata sp.]
ESAWTFPERDGQGQIIGITRRFASGEKRAMKDGYRGLTIPRVWREKDGPLLLVEGASDTLALTLCGLAAIGRPGAKSGIEDLAELLRGYPGKIIVVGENDERDSKTKPGTKEWPGKDGAESTAQMLATLLDDPSVTWAMPPAEHKDCRAWVIAENEGSASDNPWLGIGETVRQELGRVKKVGSSSSPSTARLVSRTLAEVESKEIEWLWPGRIPFGMLTMLDGDPSHGKSLITLDIASRLSTCRPMPSCNFPLLDPANVLIIAAEDTAETVIKPRCIAAGCDEQRIRVSETIRIGKDERPIRFPDDFDLLEREIVEQSIRLLIIDPLLGFLSQSIDSHKDQSVRDVLHRLKIIADKTRTAILGLRHMSKSSVAGNVLYRGLGSIAITAAARSALSVDWHPDKEGVRVMATTKCNLVEMPKSIMYRITDVCGHPVINWGDECDIMAKDLGVKVTRDDDGAMEEAIEFLKEELKDGPRLGDEMKKLAKNAGISERTLTRAKSKLPFRAHKTGFSNSTWTWELTETPARERQIPD